MEQIFPCFIIISLLTISSNKDENKEGRKLSKAEIGIQTENQLDVAAENGNLMQ